MGFSVTLIAAHWKSNLVQWLLLTSKNKICPRLSLLSKILLLLYLLNLLTHGQCLLIHNLKYIIKSPEARSLKLIVIFGWNNDLFISSLLMCIFHTFF